MPRVTHFLLLLLPLALLLPTLSLSTTPIPESCPAWIRDYATFHGAQRSNATARRLTVECPSGWRQGGLGDHLRAVVYALRVAAKHGLVLVLDLRGPLGVTARRFTPF